MGDFNIAPQLMLDYVKKLHITADHVTEELPPTWFNRGVESTIDFIISDSKVTEYKTHTRLEQDPNLDHCMITSKIQMEYHSGVFYN